MRYEEASALNTDKAENQRFQSIRRAELAKQPVPKPKKKKKKKKKKTKRTVVNNLVNAINDSTSLLPKKDAPKQSLLLRPGTAKTVKIPENNIFAVTEQALPTEMMEQLFFDSIGATEIINIDTHDQINSKNPRYSLISDIAALNTEYNVNKIVSLQKTASTYFSSFEIDFDSYTPQNGTGPDNAIVYIESATGDLIINTLDLPQNFRVEVQVMSFEDILNDTVYGII